jgi:hypothetical protein
MKLHPRWLAITTEKRIKTRGPTSELKGKFCTSATRYLPFCADSSTPRASVAASARRLQHQSSASIRELAHHLVDPVRVGPVFQLIPTRQHVKWMVFRIGAFWAEVYSFHRTKLNPHAGHPIRMHLACQASDAPCVLTVATCVERNFVLLLAACIPTYLDPGTESEILETNQVCERLWARAPLSLPPQFIVGHRASSSYSPMDRTPITRPSSADATSKTVGYCWTGNFGPFD